MHSEVKPEKTRRQEVAKQVGLALLTLGALFLL